LIDVFATEKHVYLVFEYCEVGDLEDVIRDDRTLAPAHIMSYIKMTLEGIKACHDAWILHRDLKPANLLIHSSGLLKIGDFGLARLYAEPDREMSSQVVTLWYRAPELLFGAKQYGTGVDIWSIGLIFAELVKRIPVLPGHSELDQLSKIFHLLGTPTEQDWPGLSSLPSFMEFTPKPPVPIEQIFPHSDKDTRDLVKWMLQLDPNKRPTADQALSHAYFNGEVKPTPPHALPVVTKKDKLPSAPVDEF
jgi:cyclin-dependent kinase 7